MGRHGGATAECRRRSGAGARCRRTGGSRRCGRPSAHAHRRSRPTAAWWRSSRIATRPTSGCSSSTRGTVSTLTSGREPMPYWEDTTPTISPNGRQVAFADDGKVWVVAAAGGPAREVVDGWEPGVAGRRPSGGLRRPRDAEPAGGRLARRPMAATAGPGRTRARHERRRRRRDGRARRTDGRLPLPLPHRPDAVGDPGRRRGDRRSTRADRRCGHRGGASLRGRRMGGPSPSPPSAASGGSCARSTSPAATTRSSQASTPTSPSRRGALTGRGSRPCARVSSPTIWSSSTWPAGTVTEVAPGGCYGTPLWTADGSLVVTYEDHADAARAAPAPGRRRETAARRRRARGDRIRAVRRPGRGLVRFQRRPGDQRAAVPAPRGRPTRARRRLSARRPEGVLGRRMGRRGAVLRRQGLRLAVASTTAGRPDAARRSST